MTRKRIPVPTILAYCVFIFFSVACILPFVLLIASSFTDNAVLDTHGYAFIPKKWSIGAYRFIFLQNTEIYRAYFMSILVTSIGTLSGLMISAMLAYPLSRTSLRGRRALSLYVFFTMLFSGGMVPTYLLYVRYLDIKNTLFAQLIPSLLVNGFNVMILRTYFSSNIPTAVIESAKIDGAGEMRTFLRIVMPMSTPILGTIGLMIGLGYWNNWYNGLIYITDPQYYTVQNLLYKIMLEIQFLMQTTSMSSNSDAIIANIPTTAARMAMAVVVVVPMLAAFPFLQKYFAKGLTLGAVKG
jgi:putative aldouronate transport system permease protein